LKNNLGVRWGGIRHAILIFETCLKFQFLKIFGGKEEGKRGCEASN
jgi:hypothetical protein